MKICADENISARLVEVLNSLSTKTSSLLHVRDIGAAGVSDQIWIRTFANEHGDASITADAAIVKRPAELLAVGETGLRLVILPTQYQQGGILMQTGYFLFWWPRIVELVESRKDGGFLRLPSITLPRSPSWETIDLQATKQKLRKQQRPSRRES